MDPSSRRGVVPSCTQCKLLPNFRACTHLHSISDRPKNAHTETPIREPPKKVLNNEKRFSTTKVFLFQFGPTTLHAHLYSLDALAAKALASNSDDACGQWNVQSFDLCQLSCPNGCRRTQEECENKNVFPDLCPRKAENKQNAHNCSKFRSFTEKMKIHDHNQVI